MGIMLGDGFLSRPVWSPPSLRERGGPKTTNNTTLVIEQTYTEKEGYVNFLYKLMEPVVLNSPSIVTRKPDKRTGKVSQSIRF